MSIVDNDEQWAVYAAGQNAYYQEMERQRQERLAAKVTHVYDETKEKRIPSSWGEYIEVSDDTYYEFITLEKVTSEYGAEYIARAYVVSGNFGDLTHCVESNPMLSEDEALQDLIEECEEQARERGETLYSDQGETE